MLLFFCQCYSLPNQSFRGCITVEKRPTNGDLFFHTRRNEIVLVQCPLITESLIWSLPNSRPLPPTIASARRTCHVYWLSLVEEFTLTYGCWLMTMMMMRCLC